MGVYDTSTTKCPYCGTECEADWVDVGIGLVQCSPYYCSNCGSSEIGPEMKHGHFIDENGNKKWRILNKEDFTAKELEVGWYEPESQKISPYANTVNGTLVDHQTAKKLYNLGLLDVKDEERNR